MRSLAILAATAATALAVAAAAGAAPNTASTVLVNPPATSGQTLYVMFTVFGTQPVVPYEYTLDNVCTYPPKTYGHYTLGQRDPIVYWTDSDSLGHPQVTMPVYLQSVPSGSICRVQLLDNNTVVKGSTYQYAVA